VKPPPPIDVVVRLRSTPSGAEVFEGSTQIGTTPADLRFAKDKVHALSFRLNGFNSADRTLDLSHLSDTATDLNVVLEANAVKPSDAKKRPKDAIHVFE
jgi:serine/threonine-protein kinase